MNPTTATLTGIIGGAGQCEDCGRVIRVRRFEVRYDDGRTATLGRRCAAEATGHAAARMEREAAAAIRAAGRAATDRSAGLTLDQAIARQLAGGATPGYAERAGRAWFDFVWASQPA